MKKRVNKLMAAALSLTVACALSLPAYAANITIQDTSSASTYAAERSYNGYKLLNLTTDGDHYSYTVNEDYRSVLQTQVYAAADESFWTNNGGSKPDAATNVTDAQILAYLGTLTSDSGTTPGTLRGFADDLYKAIVTASITADANAHNATFNDVEQGYWLIADVTELGGTGESNSLVLVDTKGENDLTVTPKAEVPEVEKKVKEENDSTGVVSEWQDGADYDIGDDVPFQLTGTMPSNIANYETYKYIFHDELSDGLTLNQDSITVKIGEEVLDLGTDYTLNIPGMNDDCDFEIEIADVKGIDGVTVDKNTKVVVEYTATLGEGAVIGNPGNPNEVYLEFSNNPYGDGTGKTPKDKVTVFTFKLDVDKIDGEKKPVTGAGFTLYKYDSDKKDYVAVGEEVTGTDLTNFVWKGLDSGEYKLVETKVPEGYNKADDIAFTIEAAYTTNGDEQEITGLVVKDQNGNPISGEGLTFTATVANGTVATDVVNTTGIKLPSTGGMGTTVFYVMGGVLAVGAGVLLVTRKRMGTDGSGK